MCLLLTFSVEAQQTPPPQQPPVFRAGVDVIRLDVSVLDKDRRPVRGLTQDDFSVYEDGKLQRTVAVSEIDSAERDPAPTAWMRHVARDVVMNDLTDQVGEGRLFAIVMDDVNIPFDDLDIIMAAREVGRYIVDQLSPSDVAAVVFPREAGKTQDYTDDRAKLLAAIDRFDPPEVRWIPPRPTGPGAGGGDMPYRFSPALARSQCERSQPTVPALEIVASQLATVPNRRKTLILVSVGVPLDFGAIRGCPGELADVMKDVFRIAQRANINIYGIDPAGYRGYENYLLDPIRRGGRPAMSVPSSRGAEAAAKVRREFLEIAADHTGARAIVNTNAVESEIDRLFVEARSYYLVGYQSANGKPDGKFRRVEVKVKRPGVTVRTRTGFFAPKEGSLTTAEQKAAPTSADLSLTGLTSGAALPLRVSVAPVGRASGKAGSRDADVAVVLTVRLPVPRGPLSETLTVVRTVYDAEGRAGPPAQEKTPLNLTPIAGDELRYDVYQRLTLAPGRYEIRLNATSAALDRSGSVYADVDVPDFTRAAISASGIVLGTRAAAGATRTDPLAAIVPVVPTSARDFAPNEEIVAFLRIFQGGTASPSEVAVTMQVFDAAEAKVLDAASTLSRLAFDEARGGAVEFALPLSTLSHGPHLLSITAVLPGGASVRRDLVFRVR